MKRQTKNALLDTCLSEQKMEDKNMELLVENLIYFKRNGMLKSYGYLEDYILDYYGREVLSEIRTECDKRSK